MDGDVAAGPARDRSLEILWWSSLCAGSLESFAWPFPACDVERRHRSRRSGSCRKRLQRRNRNAGFYSWDLGPGFYCGRPWWFFAATRRIYADGYAAVLRTRTAATEYLSGHRGIQRRWFCIGRYLVTHRQQLAISFAENAGAGADSGWRS